MPIPDPTEAQLDAVCERWDKTEPAMQRKIMSRLAAKLVYNEQLVKAQDELIDTMRRGRAPTRELLDKIRELKEMLKP